MTQKRILILGGTGVFGARLARHLATFEAIELFVSSRSLIKAQRLVETLKSAQPELKAFGVALDLRSNLQAVLQEIKPFAVIDCSGPFQTASFDVAQTLLRAGCHVIDLADARDYLAGYATALNETALEYGVSASTGASSTPTLSSCVVDHLSQGWERIDTIEICITPAGKSEVGQSVIQAILSYAGKPVPSWQHGRLSHVIGWAKSQGVDIPDLGRRRVAPVETYDAEYLGPRHNVQSRVSFSAGLESALEQFGINAIANLRRRKLFPDPLRLAPLLLKARRITRITTSETGGMWVHITGLNANGDFTDAKWSLLAKNDDGPFIPILPAAAVLCKLLKGSDALGASLASHRVTLADIAAQMQPYDIETKTEIAAPKLSVFETALRHQTPHCQPLSLPEPLQMLHHQNGPTVWNGKACIERGNSWVARCLSRLFSFPAAGKDVEVLISMDRFANAAGAPVERWTRSFAGKPMRSVLRCDQNGKVTEQFGPFTFVLGVRYAEHALTMPVRTWKFFQLPLPAALAPRSDAKEYEDGQGRFCFDVRLSLPIFGPLIRYHGWLVPALNGPRP